MTLGTVNSKIKHQYCHEILRSHIMGFIFSIKSEGFGLKSILLKGLMV